jgi:DNA-binding winged helix-turn-helix (wHTH) protein
MKKARKHTRAATRSVPHSVPRTVNDWLQLAQLRAEKCELAEARLNYVACHQEAQRRKDLRGQMEALAGLLRLAGEALDEESIAKYDRELDQLIRRHPKKVPPMAWFCKGFVARTENEPRAAQIFFHRYLRSVRREAAEGSRIPCAIHGDPDACIAKGWIALATTLWERGHHARARWVAEEVQRRYGEIRGILGLCSLLLGNIAERRREYDEALGHFQNAHGAFLGEHNWYYHLYVLYGYARLRRHAQNYAQAYWYLELLDKATQAREFGLLRREILKERGKLEQDAVDLLIDSRQAVVRTRESGDISLGKQYVLLHILEELSEAHGRPGGDRDRGLSKAEIIERVWNEAYRPEAHDNKLYYNINRLRKLLEPDVRKPQYLLNWKEGYRLAPGLRIQLVGKRG